MLGPELRRHAHGHSCAECDIDVPLVGALGVEIEVDAAAGGLDCGKQGFPEIVPAVRNTALAVHTDAESGDLGAGLQQRREAVAAIGRVGFRRQSGDPVVGDGIRPFVGMRPERQIELNPASCGLLADEAQRLQVALALGIGETGGSHIVSRDAQQKRIRQVEVRIGNVARTVVADSERQVETVEPVRGKRR
jgi:hypothetical protein